MSQGQLTAKLLRRAAELRVAGSSWEAVAKAVGRAVDTVRAWPRLHPRRWRQAIADAQQQLLCETTAESIFTLRHQLRSNDEKGRREAAEKLLRFQLAQSRPRPSSRSQDQAEESLQETAFAGLVSYLEKLSDAELDLLIQELAEIQELHGRRPTHALRAGSSSGAKHVP